MPRWQDFTLDSVQTSLFTPDHSHFAAGRVVAVVLRRFGDQFDGEMQALPIPADVPPLIPRVTLQSSDGHRQLNIGPARFDLVLKQPSDGSTVGLGGMVSESIEVLAHYAQESGERIGRLGLVVQRICPQDNPAQTLIQRFCNEESQREPFNRSATFEIHNHKEYEPPGMDYRINSWVRCRSAVIEADNRSAIVVQQDLNTMAAELAQRRFSPVEIRAFLQISAREADEILRKYFPE